MGRGGSKMSEVGIYVILDENSQQKNLLINFGMLRNESFYCTSESVAVVVKFFDEPILRRLLISSINILRTYIMILDDS